MEDHDHLVSIDEKTRELVVYRVSAAGEKSLLTRTRLPVDLGWTPVLEELAKTLGENLLMDSPAARRLLGI